MSKLLKAIEYLAQRGEEAHQERMNELAEALTKQQAALQRPECQRDPALADLALEPAPEQGQLTALPTLLRVGTLCAKLPGGPDLSAPLTLDTTRPGAVVFDPGAQTKEPLILLQHLALRFLLSLRPGLCRIHLADARFGQASRFLQGLPHEVLSTRDDLRQLVGELSALVTQRTPLFAAGETIADYNRMHPEQAMDYRLVWIDDWDRCLSESDAERLTALIQLGAPAHCGVFFFLHRRGATMPKELLEASQVVGPGMCDVKGATVSLDDKPCPYLSLAGAAFHTVAATPKPQRELNVYNQWVEEILTHNRLWSMDSTDGIAIPFAFDGQGNRLSFDLGDRTGDYSAFLAGKSGSGKSYLLQTLITQACLLYSPDELQLYLLDFGGGNTFLSFEQVPHVPVLMEQSSPAFALDTLQAVIEETHRRDSLYGDAARALGKNVSNIADYRRLTGKKLPRLLVVVDECQMFFPRETTVGMSGFMSDASAALNQLITQGRKYGVHVLLCTQVIGNTSIPRPINTQISCRMALKMRNVADSEALFSGFIPKTIDADATQLEERGHLLVWQAGEMHKVHRPYCKDYLVHSRTVINHQLQTEGKLRPQFLLLSEDQPVAFSTRPAAKQKADPNSFTAYLGHPCRLRQEHVALTLRREISHNILLLGRPSADLSTAAALILLQALAQSPEGSRAYIVDNTPDGNPSAHALDAIALADPDRIALASIDQLQLLKQEYDRRRALLDEGQATPERLLLLLYNTTLAPTLRPRMVGSTATVSPSNRLLRELLMNGPEVGIHLMVHDARPAFLFSDQMLGRGAWNGLFSHKILLEGCDLEELNRAVHDDAVRHADPSQQNHLILLAPQADPDPCRLYTLARPASPDAPKEPLTPQSILRLTTQS